MTKCPFCESELLEEKREIEKGVFAKVEVCQNCRDEWVDEGEHDRLLDLFRRRAFNLGGSIAIRIPKEMADALGIKEGTEVGFSVSKNKIVISKTEEATV
ncbi:MAG: AbrB/MazE/SpoVT family DNA-binding domain-containing protein [Methanocellales archaeon]|nr:AbrB/MazE/SpoVT family DNA-binding domain-containing protein [Methanocellales archaeon]